MGAFSGFMPVIAWHIDWHRVRTQEILTPTSQVSCYTSHSAIITVLSSVHTVTHMMSISPTDQKLSKDKNHTCFVLSYTLTGSGVLCTK